MDFHIIIFIIFFILMLGIIMGALKFIMWIDRKIDERERLGQSAYRPKPKKSDENNENDIKEPG